MKRFRLLMSTALTLSVFTFTPVIAMAATATNGSDPTSPSTTTTTTQKTEVETKKSTETPAQRLEKNKTKYAIKLTTADQARLKLKCKTAQIKGKVLVSVIVKNNINRTATYTKISTSLDTLIPRLKDADFDTKTLEANKLELQKKITAYSTDLTAYKTQLSDMNEMDCVTDPTGFKAALEAAREQRVLVAKDATEIRTYAETTLKTTLKEVKVSMQLTDTTTPKKEEGAQ